MGSQFKQFPNDENSVMNDDNLVRVLDMRNNPSNFRSSKTPINFKSQNPSLIKMRLQKMRVPLEKQIHDLNMMKEENYNDLKFKNVRDPNIIK